MSGGTIKKTQISLISFTLNFKKENKKDKLNLSMEMKVCTLLERGLTAAAQEKHPKDK